jgi:hyperosmotically inducible protein
MHRRDILKSLLGGTTAALAASLVAGPAQAQFTDLLTAPKTLIDRAIEARKAGDIAKDNEIVLKVNKVMAEVKSVKASTEIYEQRLLITGLFDDRATYDQFEKGVRAIAGVKKLYWHVVFLSAADQEKRKAEMLNWADVTVLESKGKARLIGTRGVADVNFRLCADAFGAVYLLGRARSKDEMDKALARAKDGEGVRKVVNYVEVRA